MQIAKDTVVTLHYEMFDADNTLLDKTEEPISYLHGGYDGIFPIVEETLHGKTIGDTVDVKMQPDDAFGEREEELIRTESLSAFPSNVEVGMVFEADDPDTGDILHFTVIEIADDEVKIDGNHPLAGRNLRFVANIVDVRQASHEEIKHGHAHGEHGHPH